MTRPNRPILTDEEADARLRAWMEPGPRSLSEPVLQRVLASVHTTRQMPAWRARPRVARTIWTARFAAAAAVVLVGAVALAVGAGGIGHSAVSGPHASTTSPPESGGPGPSLTTRRIPRVTATTLSGVVAATGATYEVRYPQVGDLADPAVADAINRRLRDGAEAQAREFTSGIGKDPQAGPNQPSTLQVDYSVAYSSPDLLSLRLNSYSYPSGAAHGADVVSTVTFDLASGRQLALADLFGPGAGYLDAVAAEARTQLRATLASWTTDPLTTKWLTTGTEPTADDYAAWAITPGGLEVTFGQYQVAPYAAGMPVVTIPYAHLAGLIDPGGPLAPLADVPLPSVTVSLGIYSGRPEPSWTLSDVQVAALVGQLASLAVATGSAPQGGLGYHGFSIAVQPAGQAEQSFVAYRGAVAGPGDAPGTYRADPQRAIESALLESGRSHLTPAEVAIVEADLARP